MNKRTKKLRTIMERHRLDDDAVAKLVGRSAGTVEIWRCANDSRIIPAPMLELLVLKVQHL